MKKAFLRIAASGPILFGLWVILAVPAGAAQLGNEKIALQYGIYSGGFEALHAGVTMALSPTHYDVTMQAQSYGFVGRLLPWAGNHKTDGTIKAGRLVPVLHDKTSNWRGDTDHVVLDYVNGVLTRQTKIKTENGRDAREAVKLNPAYHSGTTDTLSAITQMLVSVNKTGDCNFAQSVYDGKRRFTLRFTDEEMETLPVSKLNIFHGPARKCMIEMIPEKGFDKNTKGYYGIQEHARAHGQLPRVWLAPVWTDGPVMPVRIMLKTEYGGVFVHLTKVAH